MALWKYISENDYPNIILHDCCITKAYLQNSDIIFEFNESGFWVTQDSKYNPFDKTLRSDKSELRFTHCDMDFSQIYTFKKFCLFRKPIYTKRIAITFEEFSTQLNKGHWRFEFVDELYAWQSAIFNGYVWLKKKPYNLECQIQLSFDKMVYSWNKIYEDRPW